MVEPEGPEGLGHVQLVPPRLERRVLSLEPVHGHVRGAAVARAADGRVEGLRWRACRGRGTEAARSGSACGREGHKMRQGERRERGRERGGSAFRMCTMSCGAGLRCAYRNGVVVEVGAATDVSVEDRHGACQEGLRVPKALPSVPHLADTIEGGGRRELPYEAPPPLRAAASARLRAVVGVPWRGRTWCSRGALRRPQAPPAHQSPRGRCTRRRFAPRAPRPARPGAPAASCSST